MSSSGYPQIEFGYDDASDNDEDTGDGEDDVETSPDDQVLNGGGNKRQNLVSNVRSCLYLIQTQALSAIHFAAFRIYTVHKSQC